LEVFVEGEKQTLQAFFEQGAVEATVWKGAGESTHRLPVSPYIFVVDNNMIGQWGMMLGLLPMELGDKIRCKIFVPQALTEMDIQIDVKEVETVPVGDQEEEVYVCHIAPIGETCWVTKDGKLVKLEDKKQSLIVTLLTAEGAPPAEESSQDSFFLRTLPNRAGGCLIYLIVGLAWLALLARGKIARWDIWALLATGGALFPLALALQVSLQRLYMQFLSMPAMQRGLSVFILGIGTVTLGAIVQEFFKLLPVYLMLRFFSRVPDQTAALAQGAAVGAGFGLLEAILLTGNALALGIISPWAIFERVFAILFHAAVTGIVAWGVWKRSSLRYYLLAVLLHSLGNYSVILFHQHLLSPVALELSVAAFDLCILAGAVILGRKSGRVSAAQAMVPKEVCHV
jgi:RsiW-degrading membrane proteinase PrsW (M82 family)